MFDELPKNHFAAILADPPWRFATYDKRTAVVKVHSTPGVEGSAHYQTMPLEDIVAMPVRELAARNCVLFLWATWPMLESAFDVIDAWGFKYKTCAFCWMKAHVAQMNMFDDDVTPTMGNGYWTRANSEVCLLATRGKPWRYHTDVRQGIIEPRREHSRKPDCINERIERLVVGPYLELFARQRRERWVSWGNELDRFRSAAE